MKTAISVFVRNALILGAIATLCSCATNIEKITDQAKLRKIASDPTTDANVRVAAVEKLTNQVALTEIVTNGWYWDSSAVLIAAVEKLTSQTALTKIACNDDVSTDIRLVAIEKLTNQTVLTKIASDDNEDCDVRVAAVRKLTDQVGLMKIAMRCVGYFDKQCSDKVCLAAIKKITDQARLMTIATNGVNDTLNLAAVKGITNQAILTKLVDYAPNESVSIAAVKKITNQVTLTKIARSEGWYDDWVRATAVEQLTNQAILIKIANNNSDGLVSLAALGRFTDNPLIAEYVNGNQENRLAAVNGITNQTALADITWDDTADANVRVAAVKKLTDQAALARIVLRMKEAPGFDATVKVPVAAVKKLTNQALLAEIAKNDEDWAVRAAAAEKLNDQASLAKMAMNLNAGSWELGVEVVDALTNQDLLTEIANDGPDWLVRLEAQGKLTHNPFIAKYVHGGPDERLAAVRRITNQVILTKIAMHDFAVGDTAAEKLTNQSTLAKIATNWAAPYNPARLVAVKRLADQALLEKLAIEDRWRAISLVAVERLTDQAALARIATNKDVKWEVRLTAISNITDQAALEYLVKKMPQAAIRLTAIKGITDDSYLIRRLRTEPSAAVRNAIVATLHKKDSLRQVALTAYRQSSRDQAFQRLTREFGGPAHDVLAARKQLDGEVKVLATETNNARLLNLALNGQFDVLHIAAAKRLSNPATLQQAAVHSDDREVLRVVLSKLENNATLERIAVTADDRAMRLAALHKAGGESWSEIFDTATTKNASVQELGDALAAVSFFPRKQPDAVVSVQNACLNLIRDGDESRIPEMVDLLETYGDKTLAEDYLNCGQPDLNTAATKWANERGYTISTGYGSHRATWGSSR